MLTAHHVTQTVCWPETSRGLCSGSVVAGPKALRAVSGAVLRDADHEFRSLCQSILATNRTQQEWRERESDDEFQSPNYVGGYDATEDAFTFSYFDGADQEWWFQIDFASVTAAAAGDAVTLDLRSASP